MAKTSLETMKSHHSEMPINFTIMGISMQPFLKTGDELVVISSPVESMNLGSIVMYKTGDTFSARRLIKRRNDLVCITADAALKEIWVSKETIRGRAIERKRLGFSLPSKSARWVCCSYFVLFKYKIRNIIPTLERSTIALLKRNLGASYTPFVGTVRKIIGNF
ncbi:MAG: hypothetical protein PHS53_02765 [Candidatus Pacebacteria bacterium]|nr:hypothetical protein [Candidatus Paceibacterota bacterium]MDD5357046.1 hypothetical protein [Candidatus Paceibacterota bacterium]